MSSIDYLQIAVRASSLNERIEIVSQLQGLKTPSWHRAALTSLDSWNLSRLADRLTEKFYQESVHRLAPPRYSKAQLVDVLTEYRRWELSLDRADERVRDVIARVHSAWLPTYRASLDAFPPDNVQCSQPNWRRDDIYYGRAAKACEPFLLELGRNLRSVLANRGLTNVCRFDDQLVEDVEEHLFERFELSLAWAQEAHANVYCAETAMDTAHATPADYIAYMNGTFRSAESYHQFYLQFPVLGRWLAHITSLLSRFGEDLFERLADDAADLGRLMFAQRVSGYRRLRLGKSDYHAGARSVALVEAELEDDSIRAFVYKPRCIRAESAMQGLLMRLKDDGVLNFATRTVIARNGYGYEALIPTDRNRVSSREEAEGIYQELGGYLGLFYVLGGGDLHLENVMVADGHAFICDCETVLGVVADGQERPLGTLLDSVFKTGLLEWPRETAGRAPGEMLISGYSGGEAYKMPIAVPQINDRILTFQARVRHVTEVAVAPDGVNRIVLRGKLAQPEDFSSDICVGFNRVYGWFEGRAEEAAGYVRSIFENTSARFINWGTQIYAQLLISARHPRCLREPLEVDLLTNTLRTYPRHWDKDGTLAQYELSSMWRLDVPIFTALARGKGLIHDHCAQVPASLNTSPIEYAVARIHSLTPQNRVQQIHYIAASLSATQVSSPTFMATCIDYAARIGQWLCQTLKSARHPAPWTSYELTGEGMSEVDIEADLYGGASGIALFLAYLDHVTPQADFRRAAERALEHAMRRCDKSKMGAFTGVAGLIYLLTHLHSLWGDPALLTSALRLNEDLDNLIDVDDRVDLLSGAAGVIPVMLGLERVMAGAGLGNAQRCAEQLLRCAEVDAGTLSWPLGEPGEGSGNLTGFSHGAAGMGWALISFGHAARMEEYIEAGRRSFAYEGRHFDADQQDWYDLRTRGGGHKRNGRSYPNAWCNGAAGIGLSRITSWDLLGRDDETLLRDAFRALSATMRNFPLLMNDSLCHGRAGNAELFLRFGRIRKEPAFQLEANVHARSMWGNLGDLESPSIHQASIDPGLMIGMSGFGMHLLRLARPELVPSPLVLDPPQRPRDS